MSTDRLDRFRALENPGMEQAGARAAGGHGTNKRCRVC